MKRDSVDFDLERANKFDELKRLSEFLAATVTALLRERDPSTPAVTIELVKIQDRHMAPDADICFWRVGL
jgi:hypothetical protein